MRKCLLLLIASLIFKSLLGQTGGELLPYSYGIYQKMGRRLYTGDRGYHTSLKPFPVEEKLMDIVGSAAGDSTISSDTAGKGRSRYLLGKLFEEHLIDVRNSRYTAYLDFLPDLLLGRDFRGKRNTWLNTRGFQAGGTVGGRFSFYTSAFENQGRFPGWYAGYIYRTKVVPGQGAARKQYEALASSDWSYASALLSYTPGRFLNITIGQDKNFIGDGYRSMLLSDYSSNYPFLKLTANMGNVRYMCLWAAMRDPTLERLSYDAGFRRKGGVFHYLDWTISPRLSLGFFDAVIWAPADSAGNRRGFDWSYANPVILLRPLEFSAGSPDNACLGFTSRLQILPKTVMYGQFLLDEFVAKDFFRAAGDYKNKWGAQLGVRSFDLFKVRGLNLLTEFNAARPYTYSERRSILSYSHFAEPLAHPLGANFREFLAIFNYSLRRFDFQGQVVLSTYGLDPEGLNYGKDIFKPYQSASIKTGNFIGQGLKTNLLYSEVRVAFVLNPRYNLRIELAAVVRNQRNRLAGKSARWVSVGLRSSFRNFYQDF